MRVKDLFSIKRDNEDKTTGFYSFKGDGMKHECDVQGPYSFASTTKTGEYTRYCTMPAHSVATYIADVCYSKRDRDDIRTVYCSIPEDAHQIASLVKLGLPFRKARSLVDYSGRIKCLNVPKYAGSYFSNPDDISKMSNLIHDDVGLVEALEIMGYTKFGHPKMLHGNKMQLLCEMPQYDVVITPNPEEKIKGDIFVRRTDGKIMDDAADYQLRQILDRLLHYSDFFIESIDSFMKKSE